MKFTMTMEADNLEEMLAIGKLMNKNVNEMQEGKRGLEPCECEECDCPQQFSTTEVCADCQTGIHNGELKTK